MIQLRCTCGERFEVADEAAGLTADCPGCGNEVAVPSERDKLLELDRKTPPPLREITVAAEPFDPAKVPLAPTPSDLDLTSVFANEVRLADMADAVTQPEVSFAHDLLRSFGVLFGGANRHMATRMAIVDLFMPVGVWAGLNGLVLPAFFLTLVPLGWHCAVYFRACQAACAGDDDAKLVGFEGGVVEDLAKPLVRFLATLCLAMMPLWVYWIGVGLFLDTRPPMGVDMLLLAVGLFLWPATVLLMVLADSITALTPGNLYLVITRAFGAYLLTWAALAGVFGLGLAAGWLAYNSVQQSSFCPLLGLYVLVLAFSLTGLLMMRVIGLMYRHFKADLPFAAE